MILAINAGFYNTKIATGREVIVYPSRVQLNADGEKTILDAKGIYEVGAGYRSLDDKTDNTTHKLCTEYAILAYSEAERINLVTALPLNLYLNRDYRERYKAKLLGEHKGIVDGAEKKVSVIDCTVYAEGAAAYLNYKDKFKDSVVGVLDFGGNTINCMVFDNGKLIKDTISTLDLGMIKLERAIIDEINTQKLLNVQEYELTEIMKDTEYKTIIDRVIDHHISEVRQRLIEKKWNVDRMTIFATGGGVEQLGSYITKSFKKAIVSKTGLQDNVMGLMAAGNALYGGE